MNLTATNKYLADLPSMVKKVENIRKAEVRDFTLNDYIKDTLGTTVETFYEDLGVNPAIDTLENLFTSPNEAVRWLIPEIFRSAISLGLKTGPMYPDMIIGEESIKQPTITMPYINQADAVMKKVGEAETIELGTMSYGSKTVKVYKVGRGIKIPYEVRQFCSLNVVGIFLQDMGLKMGKALDGLMIDTLVNGDQPNGSESAPTVGVAAPSSIAYADLLKAWVRGMRLGRGYRAIITGETEMLNILNLAEFKTKVLGAPLVNLNLKSPIPTTADLYVHGRVAAHQAILVDASKALLKLNALQLMVESEKIVSNQTEATYATLTTGFANVFRDGRMIIDESLNINAAAYPSYMDPDTVENIALY